LNKSESHWHCDCDWQSHWLWAVAVVHGYWPLPFELGFGLSNAITSTFYSLH